jgi:hypothetical protein
MSAIAQSFANIVKTNNGRFLSQAQRNLLLNQCDESNQFVTWGAVGRNGYTLFYTCDLEGVTRVQKHTVARGLVTTWERVEAGQVSIQDAKEIRRLKRLIRQTEKSLAERKASRAAGEYPNELLYSEAQERDQRSLQELNQMLAQLT